MANVIKHKRGSGSDPVASDLVVGEVAIRTDVGKLFTKMDNGSVAEIAGGGSDIAINTLSSSSATGGGSATFNGSAYRFTLSAPPSVSAQQLLVSINGVIQKPVAGTGQPSEGFSVDGTDIILGDAPATGSDFFILTFKSLGVSEPADNSVTNAKVASNAAIAGTKISPNFGSQAISTTGGLSINGATVFNESGANVDFRVEGDTDTNLLLIDASHDRVGIGATLPEFKLDVNGEIASKNSSKEFIALNLTNNEARIRSSFYSGASGAYRPITFFTSDSEAMRIDTSGRVLVRGQAAFTSTSLDHRLQVKCQNTGDGIAIIGRNGDHSSALTFTQLDASTLTGSLSANATQFRVRSESALLFQTNGGNERMRIDSSGRVGIGCTPTAQFAHNLIQIGNQATLGANAALSTTGQTFLTHNLYFDTSGTFQVFNTSNANEGAIISLADGLFKFSNSAATTGTPTVTERMRIDSSGRLLVGGTDASVVHTNADDVVIGNTSASVAGLSIATSTSGYATLQFSDGAGNKNQGQIAYNHADNSLAFTTDSSVRMKVDSSGNMFLGLSSSSFPKRLNIQGSSGSIISLNNNDTTSFAADTSTAIEFMLNTGNTGNQFGACEIRAFKENGTNGNNARGLSFYTGANGGSPQERMRITSDGKLRIGTSLTTAAAGKFQVVEEGGGNQSNDCNAYFETNANDWNIKTYYNSAGTHYHLVFLEQGTIRGSIKGNDGSNVTYNQGSDYRWKENIVDLSGSEGIEICKKLKPRKYNWIENREVTGEINTVDGFIAHEVEEAGVLGAVTGEKDAVTEDGSIDGQMLDYGQMTPVLAAAIKGLIARVEALEAK